LVLTAVFVPCAFISGITGAFFRQFALTIAVSTIISAFNSLSLSPALTALLLRPREEEETDRDPLPWLAFVVAGGWLSWQFLSPYWPSRLPPGLLAFRSGRSDCRLGGQPAAQPRAGSLFPAI